MPLQQSVLVMHWAPCWPQVVAPHVSWVGSQTCEQQSDGTWHPAPSGRQVVTPQRPPTQESLQHCEGVVQAPPSFTQVDGPQTLPLHWPLQQSPGAVHACPFAPHF